MDTKLYRFRDPDDASDLLYLTDVYFQPWYARFATELKGVLALERGWTPNSDICEAIRQTTETLDQSVYPNVQTTPDSDIFGLTIQHVHPACRPLVNGGCRLNPVFVSLMLSTQRNRVGSSKRVIFSRPSVKEQDQGSPIDYANVEESLEPQSLDDTMAIFYPTKTS